MSEWTSWPPTKKLPCFSITSGGILELFDCCAAAAVVRVETANSSPKINEGNLLISHYPTFLTIGLRFVAVNNAVGGEFQIRPVSHSFYLDPILPLQKHEQDQLATRGRRAEASPNEVLTHLESTSIFRNRRSATGC